MGKIIYPSQIKYLENFNIDTNPLIIEMENYASENNIPILTKDSAKFLEMLISIYRPKRVLELGTAIAYSSIRMAQKLGKKGVVHTIEKSADNVKLAKANIAKAALDDKIILYEGNAFDIMPKLEKKYDFIFLDADKNDYKRLFDYCMILLKSEGIIFIDNLLWKGYVASSRVPKDFRSSTKMIREFNKMFLNQKNLQSSILTIGDGIGIGIKI